MDCRGCLQFCKSILVGVVRIVLQPQDNFGFWYGLTFVGSALGATFSLYLRPVKSLIVGQTVMVSMVLVCMLDRSDLVFLWMTGFNVGRGIVAAHSQAQALLCGPSAGTSAGCMQSVRMAVTSLGVLLGIYVSPWMLMVVSAMVPIGLHATYWVFVEPYYQSIVSEKLCRDIGAKSPL